MYFFKRIVYFVYLFIYFWLCWVLVSVRGLPPVVASGDHSSSQCTGLSLSRPLLLRSTGSRRTGSVVVAHGPSRSAACGILPDQGSNPCALHRQADSQPLRHQGSPDRAFCNYLFNLLRNYQTVFPQQLHHSAFPPAMHEGSSFSTSSPTLIFCLNNSRSKGCSVVSHCDFDLHFPDD